ncbi:sensor histidine kinase [Gorillibacterium massiliense]|uniref:sensor histidine kinase n=1 Tax=Gorillibacterium massiliense TaxID=1280390 RepID=UPI0004B861D8|nr:sensor histidine kinase [Gorillibacterium massiliense]
MATCRSLIQAVTKELLHKREWQRLDLFIFALRTLWFACSIAVLTRSYAGGDFYSILLAWFILSYLIPQVFFRPGSVRPTPYLLAETLITGGLFLYSTPILGGVGVYKFLYLPLTLGYLSGKKSIWLTAPLVLLILPALTLWWGKPEITSMSAIDFFASYCALYGLGYALNFITSSHKQTSELLQTIREKNEALEQYSRQVETIAVLEERNRVARELHDTVGHSFTTAVMGMDAVRLLIDRAPQEAKANLQELLTATRRGLDEVRASIHRMAEEEVELSAVLSRVTTVFAKHTSTSTELEIIGQERETSQTLRLVLTRCLQEALTNAKKHGDAKRVRIRLTYAPAFVELSVKDNGIGMAAVVEGFGLRSMKERLSALAGMLEVISSPGEGTDVRCRVPLREDQLVVQEQQERDVLETGPVGGGMKR